MSTAKASSPDRERILSEFETMKSFELSACDLYTGIAGHPRAPQQKIRNAFSQLARDERRHVALVQEIVDLVKKTLP